MKNSDTFYHSSSSANYACVNNCFFVFALLFFFAPSFDGSALNSNDLLHRVNDGAIFVSGNRVNW